MKTRYTMINVSLLIMLIATNFLLVAPLVKAEQVKVAPLRTPAINTGVNQAGAPTRTVSQGPATIDCTQIADSRCNGTNATPGSLPTCTITTNPPAIEMGDVGSVTSVVTANCSTGVTNYEWNATNGTTPIGQQQSMTYFNPGNYCYTVAGRNPSVNLNFGAASPQKCVTVTRTAQDSQCTGASALPANTTATTWGAIINGSYSTCSSAPTLQAGYQYYLLNTAAMNSSTCPWEGPYTQVKTCDSCPIGTSWNGSSCSTNPTCELPKKLIDDVCQCPLPTTGTSACPSPMTGTYTFTTTYSGATCTANTTTNQSTACTASCTGGRTWNGSACVCPAGTTWDAIQSICRTNPTCELPKKLIDDVCQCPLPTTGTSACPSPMTGTYTFTTTYSGATCTANTTTNQSTACTASCTGGRTWNGSACVCPADTTWDGATCSPKVVCELPMQIINRSCQCPISTSGTSACPPPTTGTYTFSTSYSGPTCAASTTSNQSSACVAPTPVVCYAWQTSYIYATQDHTLTAITRDNNPPVMQGVDGLYHQLYLVAIFLSGQGGNTTC